MKNTAMQKKNPPSDPKLSKKSDGKPDKSGRLEASLKANLLRRKHQPKPKK